MNDTPVSREDKLVDDVISIAELANDGLLSKATDYLRTLISSEPNADDEKPDTAIKYEYKWKCKNCGGYREGSKRILCADCCGEMVEVRTDTAPPDEGAINLDDLCIRCELCG